MFLLFAVSAYAGDGNAVLPSKSSDIDSASQCGMCHKRIFEEWSGSMHAHATSEKDPIVGAFYSFLGKEGYDLKKCDKCHAPFKAMYSDDPANTPKHAVDGVGCPFCHAIRGKVPDFDNKFGTDYFQLDFSTGLSGPRDYEKKGYHTIKGVEMFWHVDICAGCHKDGESVYYKAGNGHKPCQLCHMPYKKNVKIARMGKVREKGFRHLFEGGHSEYLLGLAVGVSGLAEKADGKTVVNITLEGGARHKTPVGFPLRQMYMKVTALDDGGNTVWSNYKSDPLKEDPQSFLARQFSEKDELYAHHVKDVKPVKDQSLSPAVSKEFTYRVSSDKVASFQVHIYYRLF